MIIMVWVSLRTATLSIWMITIQIGIALRSGVWYPWSARPKFSETRQVVILRMHHRRSLSFLFGSGDIGIVVYAVMTALNALMIITFFR